MELNFNYMVLEKLELTEINNNNLLGLLSFRDDSYCKSFRNEIVIRSLDEKRKITRCCELKKRCNIIIDIFTRTILEINSIDDRENIYTINCDPGGNYFDV